MKDGIIKGNGASRLLKSKFPGTYEEFCNIASKNGIPVDVLFNPDGWQQPPDFLSKATLLKDATALGYNLTKSATPDDVFKLLMVTNGAARTTKYTESAVLIVCTNADGAPVPGISISIDGVSSTTNFLGCAKIYVSNGTKKIEYSAAIGYTFVSGQTSVETKRGEVSVATAVFDVRKTGVKRITKTGFYGISPMIKTFDICVVGGGGGGFAYNQRDKGGVCHGGSGGYTNNKLGIQRVDEKTVNVTVGAGGYGGSFVFIDGSGVSQANPNDGGTSVVEYNGETTTANGGACMKRSDSGMPHQMPSGGSGVGGIYYKLRSQYVVEKYYVCDSGEDGKPGGKQPNATMLFQEGNGQGKTTRAFGEPDGELFSSAGASAVSGPDTIGKPGFGGGEAKISQGGSETFKGGDAKTPGSGGGGAISYNIQQMTKGGNGADGIVLVRWHS